jgi:hypothetical protein
MIRYALQCEHDHPFEGWFPGSSAFDDQQAKGLIECPYCASRTVRKQIMSPSVSGTKTRGGTPDATPEVRQMMMQAMSEVRRQVEDNFDYVGDSFATEARAIHEGKSEERGIYGEASQAEVKSLIEDGVKVAPLPPRPTPKEKLN